MVQIHEITPDGVRFVRTFNSYAEGACYIQHPANLRRSLVLSAVN